MSAAMTEQQATLSTTDLRAFPRKVSALICELVNDYGVRYRIQKGGGHIFLYNGDTKNGPHKVSASRPVEDSMHWMDRWIDANVPQYRERPVTDESLKVLAEAVSTTDTHEPVVRLTEPGWTVHKHGFETNGEAFRCMETGCGYTQPDPRGLHFHAAKHSPEGRKQMSKSASTARDASVLARQQRRTMEVEALRVLANRYGLILVEKGEGDPAALRVENEGLRKELDDTKARLALIKEAMKA